LKSDRFISITAWGLQDAMNTRIDDPSDVIGQRIRTVTSRVTGVHPDTHKETFRYLIQLSNGVTLDCLPGELSYGDYVHDDQNTPKLQVIDGLPELGDEEIAAIVTRIVAAPMRRSKDIHDVPRYVALVFSSGRAAMNVYQCGGGSILHVESVSGLTRHFGMEWRDFWTDEILDLESLPSHTRTLVTS
jgi:hypothetical protein